MISLQPSTLAPIVAVGLLALALAAGAPLLVAWADRTIRAATERRIRRALASVHPPNRKESEL